MDAKAYNKREPDLISVKRNPYLVDYEEQRKLRELRSPVRETGNAPRGGRRVGQTETAESRETGRRRTTRTRAERSGYDTGAVSARLETKAYSRERTNPGGRRGSQARAVSGGRAVPREQYADIDTMPSRKQRAVMERKRAAAMRRRIVRLQRMTMLAGLLCIALLLGILFLKRLNRSHVSTGVGQTVQTDIGADTVQTTSETVIQGLPAEEFSKHPEWTEDFLTVNEYSRPGEALPEVKNIFVHYTANPRTSAAQNRSYFEALKDNHDRSASAHFIIGYEGEIIQCIPLNEIAYAVMTRNYDSISIECCYLASDGSFTQETYDSLIKLLAWLTDVYDLDEEDILRHYDCGGKKCPIYYTEHEDAWEQLKKDVAAY